jgi:hypothetical protein
MTEIKAGDSLAYYAAENSPADLYSGPYPAKVVEVLEREKKTEPLRVNLLVRFTPDQAHPKSNVPLLDVPTKHAAAPAPEGFTYENWFERLHEQAAAAVAEEGSGDDDAAKVAEQRTAAATRAEAQAAHLRAVVAEENKALAAKREAQAQASQEGEAKTEE